MSGETPGGDAWTVGRLLTWTTDWLASRGSESPRLDAEVLLAHVRGCPRILLYTAFDTPVDEQHRGRFRELVKRRGDGEPVAYLVGEREFFSVPFRVSPSVLVPRPETEGLVVRALDLVKEMAARGVTSPRIVDVGTGSGAIAITVARHLPDARVTATDISSAAIAVARDNAGRLGVSDRLSFVECDLFDDPAVAGPWDIVISNPPYVREDEFAELPRDVRDYEPRGALVAGPTGVEVLERLVALAAERMAPGGWLLIEIGPGVAAAAEAAVTAVPTLVPAATIQDAAGLPRILQARKN